MKNHAYTQISDISSLGTILGIWAHPDDETFSMAGLMAVAVKNGQTVACVTATKGEAGVQDEERWPAETLSEVRSVELANALNHLGVNKHHWLGYRDGHCNEIEDSLAVSNILALIRQYQPDTIITFPPDGLTGHEDHKSVSRWAKLAVQESGLPAKIYYTVNTREMYDKFLREADEKFNIFFNLDKPVLVPMDECDMAFTFPEDIVTLKIEALALMPSQTSSMIADNGSHWMEGAFCCESFVSSEREHAYWTK